MNNPFVFGTLMVFMLMQTPAICQTIEVALWPDGVPNQKTGLQGEKTVVENGITTHVSEVTGPTITLYKAKTDGKTLSKAVVICPGGGYSRLSIEKEGHAIARFLSENGITGIVLKYRLPDDAFQPEKTIAPIMDARQAMKIVRERASEWNIDSTAIGIMGFSAGGHLAATVSTRQSYSFAGGANPRPDFSILIYPVISMKDGLTHGGSRERLLGKNPCDALVLEYSNEMQVNGKTPPTFLVHSFDDKAVPVENTLKYMDKLRENHVECEVHLYKVGGHGYGMNKGHTDSWPSLMVNWIKSLKL
jgi:acetyl esterase/lipase